METVVHENREAAKFLLEWGANPRNENPVMERLCTCSGWKSFHLKVADALTIDSLQ
jgi:hypothetical protein